MYVNKIFNYEEEFVQTLMTDFKLNRDEIGIQNGYENFDDCIFISTRDNRMPEKSFWYFKGKSGRIIIVEES